MTSTSYILYKNNPKYLVDQIFEEYGYVEEAPIKAESKKDLIIKYWLDGEKRPPMLAQIAGCTTTYAKEVIRTYIKRKYEIHTTSLR